MSKGNTTFKFCHVLHVAHKHELHKLTMTSLGVILTCRFCLQGMLANIPLYNLTAVTIVFLLSNLWQILDVAFLLPLGIQRTIQILLYQTVNKNPLVYKM